MRRTLSALALGLVCLCLTACGDGDGDTESGTDAPVSITYDSERVAPLRSEISDQGSDEHPSVEDALIELKLDSGGQGVLWIDQEDISKVYFQTSDPKDPDAWTEPKLIFTAGDGCLIMTADTSATTVAVGLGCYEDDAFIQQAPDQGALVVTSDLVNWDSKETGESAPSPTVSEDGTEATWKDDVYGDEYDWSIEDGL